MQLPLIDRIRSFIQAEAVLVVAALAALLSACLFPPTPQNWSAYAEAIDWRTIGLLFCLMTVVAGFTRAGLLARVRSLLTRTEGTQRRLSLLLVTLSFFTAMIVTNDVALISFAPLTLLLFQGSEPRSTIITLVAQTVAANLGSMMTPIGNPQNIYNMRPTDIHYEIADWAIAGNRLNGLGTALWFFNPFSPSCRANFPSNVGTFVMRIGDHCFYNPTAAYYDT